MMSSGEAQSTKGIPGGRFDFDDGGTFCGGWEDGKAFGHGVCTGPKGQGEYSGSWHSGFEVSGVYTWPSGSTYEGQWQSGKRNGFGVETRGRWVFRGEWTAGLKGRYGVRQCITSGAKYDGTWANGLPDGYGSETYADGGTFQGQWMKGMRHGYGVRTSAQFAAAAPTKPKDRRGSLSSLNGEVPAHQGTIDKKIVEVDTVRGGFVLKTNSSPTRVKVPDKMATIDSAFLKRAHQKRPKSSTWRKPASNPSYGGSNESLSSGHTGESARTSGGGSNVSGGFAAADEFADEIIDNNAVETYMGEWKNDRRSGFGIAERTDGVKYEGEWYNNKKYGYGITTFKTGMQECGKYINNVLVTSGNRSHLFFLRNAKFRRKLETAVSAAARAAEIALQKADIAVSRTATARGKAEQADVAAAHAREDSKIARMVAKQFAPEFQQPGIQQKLHVDSKNFPSLEESSPHSRSKSLYLPGAKSSVHASRDLINIEVEPPTPAFHYPEPANPAQSAFLNVFCNNPDRRPSAAGLNRRPSCFGQRRPSTVVELKLAPQVIEQSSAQPPYSNPQYSRQQQYHHQQQQHHQDRRYPNLVNYSIDEVVEDHYSHYKQQPCYKRKTKPILISRASPTQGAYPALSHYYGPAAADDTPDSGISETMENEQSSPLRPPRRSTLPTALNPDSVRLNFQPVDCTEEEDEPLLKWDGEPAGVVRSGSLQHVPRKAASNSKSPGMPARKKSLPDITQISSSQKNVLTREAIAVLSSQRREAIRREEEEQQRLRGNPLLYLLSPNMKDWLSQQQLIILLLFINISLAILFFKLLS